MSATGRRANAFSDWLGDALEGRPTWMNALMIFCAFMTFVYVPWDLFWKPLAEDEDVWFGILFTGRAAKLGALAHGFVYAALLYGFRRMRDWMPLWSGLYVAQVAFSMFVWTAMETGGLLGLILGVFPALPFAALALALWTSEEHFVTHPKSLRERYGDWALVTGASAGIGAEFARALARDGLGVVLVARREEQLRSLAEELEKSSQVETRVVAADLAEPDAAARVAEAVADLEIAVLVNNAGVGYAGRFDLQDAARTAELVDLNCRAPLLLTHAFLPAMRERGRGAVIFTGSVAGSQPLPLHATYSASKAFDNFMAEALYVENKGAGVDVLGLLPGPVQTDFAEISGGFAHGGELPAESVRCALEALGHQPTVVSGWFNWLRATLAQRIATRPLAAYVARDVTARNTPGGLR